MYEYYYLNAQMCNEKYNLIYRMNHSDNLLSYNVIDAS